MSKLLKRHEIVNLQGGRKDWYRIENAAADVADVYIYGEIGYDVTANDFIKALQGVTASKMNVHVATNGGDVFDGVAILNALRCHAAEVTTIVDSQALSAGSFIMQGGNKRVMMPNSTMMIHDALCGGGYAYGNAADMRDAAQEFMKLADMLDNASNNIASIYASRAGGTVEDWRAIMKAETWYSAEDAVAAGLADEVMPMTPPKKMPPSENATQLILAGHNEAPVPTSSVPDVQFNYAELFRKALQEVYK